MIKRYTTKCLTCGCNNTLRITLGTDKYQIHTFACNSCGTPSRVRLDLDFVNLETHNLTNDHKVRSPKPTISFLENCELSDFEGSITNLDPNFLISEENLHKDKVFSWMLEMTKIGILPDQMTLKPPQVNDVITGLGGQRNFREILVLFINASKLHSKKKTVLANIQLKKIQKILKTNKTWNFISACFGIALMFIGYQQKESINKIIDEVKACKKNNENEYNKFRKELILKGDFIERQIQIITEYIDAYDQLFQAWIYAARDTSTEALGVASSTDLNKVKMFYGNLFEHLASGLVVPACLNNIKAGRAYDQFNAMTLQKYLTTDKANRHNPFADNVNFALLYNEFDSSIRNASHHGNMKVSEESNQIIQYKSTGSKNWKTISYSAYLIKCNRIMLCSMRLLVIQSLIVQDEI